MSVGLDVHARSVSACVLDTATGEVIRRRLAPVPEQIVAWVSALDAAVAVAYEAGPTGFGLARMLAGVGVRCVVAARSKLSRPSGDRVKTDARDAELLARLLRLDELTAIRVPSQVEEAARDLTRAREDARGDLMRARHRVSKLLLRQGIVYDHGQAWTQAHRAWLRRQSFDAPGLSAAWDAALEAVMFAEARRDRLDRAIAEMAGSSPWTPMVARLGCLRGISTLTGFALAVEIGDWDRFDGSTIGSYLGLVPSEHSSGTRRSQAGITKTGNTHARRLLVEAAWHHRPAYRPSAALQARWDQAPGAVRVRAHAGNQRLHARWQALATRRKRPVIANVAIARELAGWCWSLATLTD